jgi:hypothetical protein
LLVVSLVLHGEGFIVSGPWDSPPPPLKPRMLLGPVNGALLWGVPANAAPPKG